MDFTDVNRNLYATIRAAHKAGLVALAAELHAVTPVESLQGLRDAIDRCATVRTLMRLRPPTQKQLDLFGPRLDSLDAELRFITSSL